MVISQLGSFPNNNSKQSKAAFMMVKPNYQDLRGDNVPVIHRPGVEVKVFSGRSGNIEAIPRVSMCQLLC